jgi:hypothetical protein
VVPDGTELAGGEVGSRKSRTLLKLLAVERPGLVPVDRIVDMLWADAAWRRRSTACTNGDPLGAPKHVRQALKPDGTWLGRSAE